MMILIGIVGYCEATCAVVPSGRKGATTENLVHPDTTRYVAGVGRTVVDKDANVIIEEVRSLPFRS